MSGWLQQGGSDSGFEECSHNCQALTNTSGVGKSTVFKHHSLSQCLSYSHSGTSLSSVRRMGWLLMCSLILSATTIPFNLQADLGYGRVMFTAGCSTLVLDQRSPRPHQAHAVCLGLQCGTQTSELGKLILGVYNPSQHLYLNFAGFNSMHPEVISGDAKQLWHR